MFLKGLLITICLLAGSTVMAQEKPAASGSQVDTVIQLVKGGMSESLIIKTLQRQNKPADLSPADMLKLQNAKVPQSVIAVMLDPSAVPTVSGTSSIAPATPAEQPVAISGSADATGPDCPQPQAIHAAAGSEKRRLAVNAFDYSAVKTQVTAMFNNDVNIGQGIRAMLETRLGQSKTVVLLERAKADALMKEQDFGNTGRVNQATKARTGRLTGADAILLGDIVIFGRDDKSKGGKGGGYGLPGIWGTRTAGMGKVFGKEEKAVVAITLRLVDAETGEFLETAEARGESKRTSRDIGGFLGSWKGGGGGEVDMNSSNFQETIIGEATSNAVDKVVEWLDEQMPKIAAKSRSIEGRIATFDGCTVYLSVGAKDGVRVGDQFEIDRIVKAVLDPQTHEVLDQQTEKIGDMVVSTVRDQVAIGSYGGPRLSAPWIAKPGYAARIVTH